MRSSGQRERRREAHADADHGEREAFAHDEFENVAALGAHRDANSDFACALADEEGNDAV